jgi:hypothetical protein
VLRTVVQKKISQYAAIPVDKRLEQQLRSAGSIAEYREIPISFFCLTKSGA